jgi:hypothetical protein
VSDLAVLTPSYLPDLELCRDLNRSVLESMPDDVCHHIIVPNRHRGAFDSLRGSRTEVWTVDQFVPRRIVAAPGINFWVNLRRPYPPVRGWVMQQLVKLRAAAELGADLVVLADSDVRLVRPTTIDTFRPGGEILFYRQDGVVDERMPKHLVWHKVARRLLGLPSPESEGLPDYISAFNVWDRRVVQALCDRIELVTGRPWFDALSTELHVSEFILYGVFVDDVLERSAGVVPTDSMLCHNYWDTSPLAPSSAAEFVRALRPEDVAVMISAKSHTPLTVRRQAFSCIPAAATHGR